MKLHLAAATAALTCLAFGSAAQASVPITATLAAPLASPSSFVAGGAMWRCEGTTCVAASADRTTLSVGTCRQVVRRAGRVTAFASPQRSLDDDKLVRCNA
jgi:hypothetical protein